MTDVPWATKAWHVVRGCTPKSCGCVNCFAARYAATRGTGPKTPQYHGLATYKDGVARWNGIVRYDPDELMKPFRRRVPTHYFVGMMGDLCHEQVSFDVLAEIFAVMAICAMHERPKRHTFLLLTKRPERLEEFYAWPERQARMASAAGHLMQDGDGWLDALRYHLPWPLPNVWPGVSAEGQAELDERGGHLLNLPVHHQAGRWLSIEPQLEAIEVCNGRANRWSMPTQADARSGRGIEWTDPGEVFIPFDGIIQGCESGSGRRPFDIEWAISMHRQCQDAGVAYYLKQVPGPGGKIDKGPQLYGRTWRELPWAT